jgi:hypothetical protein
MIYYSSQIEGFALRVSTAETKPGFALQHRNKHMNTTDTIRAFGARKPTTAEEWKKLIEDRIEMISPFLDSMTLGRIGGVRYPSYWSTTHGPYHGHIGDEVVKWAEDTQFGSSTQGIFVDDISEMYNVVKIGHKAIIKVWGFTRKKQWVTASIRAVLMKNTDSKLQDAGNMVTRFFELQPIKVIPASINALAASSLREKFWNEIGLYIEYWHTKAEERLNTLKPLAEMVKVERAIFEACA